MLENMYYGGYSHNGLAQFLVLFGFAVVILLLLLLAAFLTFYILESIGLYHISRCRGIDNAFLAWIPVARAYLLGSIADQISAHENKRTVYSTVLLICSGVTFLLGFVTGITDSAGFLSWVAIVVTGVFSLLAYYQIFKVHAPQKATLYLVLSVILGLGPVFVFAVRNRVPTDMLPPPPQNYPPQYPPYPGQGGYPNY